MNALSFDTHAIVDLSHLATKSDLRETAVQLEAKIEAARADTITWMFGTIGFQTLVILGAVITLARNVTH